MIRSTDYIGFKSMAERVDAETIKRKIIRGGIIKFRNPFLRATLGGVVKNDTILIGAETGVGKTQLASEIAEDAALTGKKVFVFALEADVGEWERRRKFGVICNLYLNSGGTGYLDYQDWMQGELNFLDKYEDKANELMKANSAYNNIYTFYKEKDFGLDDFVKKFSVIEEQADLVVVDHIHYFDLFSSDHNEELSKIMKTIRLLTQNLDVPVILIAHLRKLSKGENRKLIPDISDFHGSSELSKVCTRAIMLSPGEYDDIRKGYHTYIKAVKNRWGRSRTDVVGRIFYNPSLDKYDEDLVEFGREDNNGNFNAIAMNDLPYWIKRNLDSDP